MKKAKKICPQCRKPKHPECKLCKKPAFTNINRDNQSFYNSTAWRKLSKAYKVKHPLCIMCLERGVTRQTDITDHIIPIDKGGDKWSTDNLQPLCSRHHNSKTGSSK